MEVSSNRGRIKAFSMGFHYLKYCAAIVLLGGIIRGTSGYAGSGESDLPYSKRYQFGEFEVGGISGNFLSDQGITVSSDILHVKVDVAAALGFDITDYPSSQFNSVLLPFLDFELTFHKEKKSRNWLFLLRLSGKENRARFFISNNNGTGIENQKKIVNAFADELTIQGYRCASPMVRSQKLITSYLESSTVQSLPIVAKDLSKLVEVLSNEEGTYEPIDRRTYSRVCSISLSRSAKFRAFFVKEQPNRDPSFNGYLVIHVQEYNKF